MGSQIEIRGAGEHNLRNIDVKIPRDSLTVVTGVSGSGKSSLAFDTIFQEGQRKYIESLSSYARQFIGQMKIPEVEHISGLSPTISIDQKTVNRNPRSTVGTVTGIYDFFRLLFARLGTPHCPSCGDVITSQTIDQISDSLFHKYKDESLLVMAPLIVDRKGEYRKEQKELTTRGFIRVRIDGVVHRIDEGLVDLKRYEKHTLEAVIDRISLVSKNLPRFREAMEQAVSLTDGLISFLVVRDEHDVQNLKLKGSSKTKKNIHILQSTELACGKCGTSMPEIEPRLFSFNSVQGACSECEGLGIKQEFDPDLIIPDKTLSVEEGAIKSMTENGNIIFSHYGIQELRVLAREFKFSLKTPFIDLPQRAKDVILYGSEKSLKFKLVHQSSWRRSTSSENRAIRGVLEVMQRVWNRWHIPMMQKYMQVSKCTTCMGKRLSPESLAVTYRGYNIVDFNTWSIEKAGKFFSELKINDFEKTIGREIFKEIRSRLGFLNNVGLEYLTLDRSAATLSGGEGQRIRLASQVGAGLQGVLYILDEPSIGLHARDNIRLLQTLYHLRNLGNSLIVVEHDEETMQAADYIMDIGPGAGVEGGTLVARGTLQQLKKNKKSLTARYLTGKQAIVIPTQRRNLNGKNLTLQGASQNNLKNIDVTIPLGVFVAITGVSGSGKSTLINNTLKRALARHLYKNTEVPGKHKNITGLKNIDRLVEINQSPIGRTPRSNPVTYTKVFNHIRDLFADLPESKIRGYKKGRFSFNVKGGRCEYCGGAGVTIVEMQLLADVTVPCEECQGKRFNDSTLEVHFKGHNIYNVLEMSVARACEFFSANPKVRQGLEMLNKIGLGYIRLGQPSTTLSGGEAQRVKLATELQKPGTGKTLFLLDEPTTGLHFKDIANLLDSLQTLVEQKNTVVVIEHNLDVIKVADHVIDLGPEGGDKGGRLIAQGTPEKLARSKKSYTGRALAKVLGKNNGAARPLPAPKRGKQLSRNLKVTGGRKHNLKNVDVEIPRHKFTVITGVSGSGKSSLAFGTLFAEGQRRFIESLSTYARRFLGRIDKGEVDNIDGLAPAIAIDQKSAGRSSKSTVATITEIYDYFRLLYARLGVLHCPHCHSELMLHSIQSMVKEIITLDQEKSIRILAPLFLSDVEHDFFLGSASQLTGAASQLRELGFRKIFLDKKEYTLDKLPKKIKKDVNIFLYVDFFKVKPGNQGRLNDAIESALEKGHGIVFTENDSGKRTGYSTKPYCNKSHYFMKDSLEPKNFSFNSHHGACEECEGVGIARQIDVKSLIGKPDKSLITVGLSSPVGNKIKRRSGYYHHLLKSQLVEWGYDMGASYNDLSPEHKQEFLYGAEDYIRVIRRRRRSTREYEAWWQGIVPMAEKWFDKYSNSTWTEAREKWVVEGPCQVCGGSRLMQPFSEVTFKDINMGELCRMTVGDSYKFFSNLRLNKTQKLIGEQIFREILGRLSFLVSVGLPYLSLDRVGSSLSGGEAQRIRLAGQIGSGLEGVLYVLDEPTVGLHQRDTRQLVKTLERLRNLGNTVVVVEHDPEMISSADWVVDMGPRAGEFGGEVVATGTPAQVTRNKKSLTGDYLSGRKKMENFPESTTIGSLNNIEVKSASRHNLQNLSLAIPTGKLVVFCGVSGSGKSTLVMDVVMVCVKNRLLKKSLPRGLVKGFLHPKGIGNLMAVDQSPLGSNPRSSPVTYGKVYDKIRELFASVPDAKVRGFTRTRFSVNTGLGRCEKCEGMGQIKIEMHFISDVWVTCDSCKGKRFNEDTLDIRFKGKTIGDVLDLRVAEAVEFFKAHKAIHKYIETLNDVGLGYMRLGQSAATLSGGEAQRVKLAAELARGSRTSNLYILDEPTTGLHLADIHMLMNVLKRLVAKGHTVYVIEHQLNVIKNADWIVELGPEGGAAGGKIIFQGPPGSLKMKTGTPTARALSS